MSNTEQFKAQVDALQQQTLDIFEELAEKTRQFELPPLPAELDEYHKKLISNTYTVLVVGEAKRGKSSFVNALIGRDLLPTDVAVATNQVFRVSNAEQEAYRLRFEDESTQNISAAELMEYGSQTVADQKKITRFNLDLLRWIEVDLPFRFLPPGVSTLDTPGLGTLYAAHAQITQRFVPHADAVIFVLDSNQPIGQFELDFVEAILKVTRHIFFIQTKIDLYDKEVWQQVQKRNETILQGHFKDRLDDTRVWPISSRNLMKAIQTNSAALRKVSRQQELLDALEEFLFKVAGWNRCAEALLIADHYYAASRKTLDERLAELEKKSTQELIDMRQAVGQRREQLEAVWGEDGKKRQEQQTKVKTIANASKRAMVDMLEPGSELEMSMRRKIDAVKSIDEANQLGTRLSEDVVTAATHRWHEVCEQTNSRYATLLGSFIEDINASILPPESPDLVARFGAGIDFPKNIWGQFDKAETGFILGTNTGIAMVLIASSFIPITLPVAMIGIAIAGCLGAVQQWRYTAQEQLKQAQQKLHEHLTNVIREVRKSFLDTDPKYDGDSLVNHYFNALARTIEERMAEVIEEKSKLAQQESLRLAEQSKLDKQQRHDRAEKLRAHLEDWDELGRSIRTTADGLKRLEVTPVAIGAADM